MVVVPEISRFWGHVWIYHSHCARDSGHPNGPEETIAGLAGYVKREIAGYRLTWAFRTIPTATAAKIVHFLAIHVHEWHLPIQRYIADPDRNRMHLPMMLQRIQCLMDDLRHNIHHIIPRSVYAIHLQSSFELQGQLVALESGYSTLPKTVGSTADRLQRGPESIPDDQLRQLMVLEYTDGEIAEIFGGSTKTIQRRRKGIGLLRRAFLHSTTDARLTEVSDCVLGAT